MVFSVKLHYTILLLICSCSLLKDLTSLSPLVSQSHTLCYPFTGYMEGRKKSGTLPYIEVVWALLVFDTGNSARRNYHKLALNVYSCCLTPISSTNFLLKELIDLWQCSKPLPSLHVTGNGGKKVWLRETTFPHPYSIH